MLKLICFILILSPLALASLDSGECAECLLFFGSLVNQVHKEDSCEKLNYIQKFHIIDDFKQRLSHFFKTNGVCELLIFTLDTLKEFLNKYKNISDIRDACNLNVKPVKEYLHSAEFKNRIQKVCDHYGVDVRDINFLLSSEPFDVIIKIIDRKAVESCDLIHQFDASEYRKIFLEILDHISGFNIVKCAESIEGQKIENIISTYYRFMKSIFDDLHEECKNNSIEQDPYVWCKSNGYCLKGIKHQLFKDYWYAVFELLGISTDELSEQDLTVVSNNIYNYIKDEL